ncbi:MAG TPA: STAS domain-containing protein [Polyangiaceae bacterium]|jgi:rsbT co-antagonist protein RsbR|nr:STAS domain-containing protein [Polyangiaceae bacterium]
MAKEDATTTEIEALRAQVATLEQLLATHEEAELEHAARMERMIQELEERAEQLSQSEAALRRQSAILHWMLDNMTDGLVVLDESGTHLLSNKAAERVTGDIPMGLPREREAQEAEDGKVYLADGETACSLESEPLLRALRGEEVRDLELLIHRPSEGVRMFVSVNATPLRDETGIRGAIGVFRDITERKRHEDEMEAQRGEVLAAERAKNEALERLQQSQADLIRKQQLALQELSTPILDVWDDVLALPIIGTVDSSRSAQIMERLLSEIVAKRSRWVIIDVTGVEIIDTQTASHFLRVAKAVELLGARCLLTGLRPAVAQTLVQLNVDLREVRTLRNLKHGLRHCIDRRLLVGRDLGARSPKG